VNGPLLNNLIDSRKEGIGFIDPTFALMIVDTTAGQYGGSSFEKRLLEEPPLFFNYF
jgi:hypothetical protein